MNLRLTFVFAALAATIGLFFVDLRLRSQIGAATAAQKELAAQGVMLTRGNTALQQNVETMRANLAAVRQAMAKASPPAGAKAGRPENPVARAQGSVVRIETAAIADSADLRRVRVQAYVGERRMMFASLLHRLGLTSGQLQRFDAIQAEFQQATLDLASSAKAQAIGEGDGLRGLRQQLVDTRDAQLRDLFGANYPAWQDAIRTQGARSTVSQLLQQSFPAVGPIENSQTEQLIDIFARHAQPATPGGYDWSAVTNEAASVLKGSQLDAFKSAITFRRLGEEAQALAASRH